MHLQSPDELYFLPGSMYPVKTKIPVKFEIPKVLNRKMRIVYQPNPGMPFSEKRRFAVGAYSLSKYVGEDNAKTAIQRAISSLDDKYTVRLRKHGRIDFYFK